MTIKIEIELDCDFDTGSRIRSLIDKLLERNIEPKYKLIRWAKTTIKEMK